ncbi:MAG: formate/nitrite transporter family protein [Lactobacillus sp.]|jgi:formate/nitrite transporter|nr:formate/nitrite transporter family protein [Lactobacillus sp.]
MNYLSPKEIAAEFCHTGSYKADMPLRKFTVLAFLGGAFIALGGLLSVMVAGGMPEVYASNPGFVKFVAGAMFPVGLIMVTVAGADLFTSDCAYMVFPCSQKHKKITALLKIWIVSYVINFVGTQFVAYFMVYKTGVLSSEPWTSYLHHYSEAKVNQDFWTVFWKGIGANWLVCLGTWMGVAGKDIVGKAVGIWLPVMLFVTLGFEHSIANMFFIPAAIYTGADILWSDFVTQNLIPATIGNIIGGAGLVGVVYWYVYSKD